MLVISSVPKAGSHAVMALLARMGLTRQAGTIQANTPDQTPHIDFGEDGKASGDEFTEWLRQYREHYSDRYFVLAHVCAASAKLLDGFPVLTVFRDPRNCLTSYCRHRARTDGAQFTIAQAIADYWGAPFIPTYQGYLPWRGRAVVMRFEDLPPAVVGNGDSIYPNQNWNTRTDQHSDWVNDWQREDHAAWREAGGRELARDAGY